MRSKDSKEGSKGGGEREGTFGRCENLAGMEKSNRKRKWESEK